jgi:hypothetical protein
LSIYAAKYIWWKTPDEALHQPERIVAQVMELGDYEDVQAMVEQLGDQYLKMVLLHAQAGVFSPKSWAYWHYRLGLSGPGQVPALPKRRLS